MWWIFGLVFVLYGVGGRSWVWWIFGLILVLYGVGFYRVVLFIDIFCYGIFCIVIIYVVILYFLVFCMVGCRVGVADYRRAQSTAGAGVAASGEGLAAAR